MYTFAAMSKIFNVSLETWKSAHRVEPLKKYVIFFEDGLLKHLATKSVLLYLVNEI